MAKLKKLERLDLGDNEIEELPPHIGALVSLEGRLESSYFIFSVSYPYSLNTISDPVKNLNPDPKNHGIRIRIQDVFNNA